MNYRIFKMVLLLLFISASAFARTPLTLDEHTVALWNFDEGKGFIVRNSVPNGIDMCMFYNGNKSTESPAKWIDDKFGKSLLFNGELRQSLGNADGNWNKFLGLSDAVTFEAWIKPEDPPIRQNMGLFQNMVWQKSGFRINLREGLEVELCLQNGSTEIRFRSKKALSAGLWSHIACTYDGVIMKIYINGALDNEKSIDGGVIQATTPAIYIASTGGTPCFFGAISCIRISKIARSNFDIESE